MFIRCTKKSAEGGTQNEGNKKKLLISQELFFWHCTCILIPRQHLKLGV